MRNLAVAAAIAGMALTGFTGEAFAHAHLTSAVPPVNATVTTAPTELDLHFTEAVNLRFTGVTVTAPDKSTVAIGDARLANGDTTLIVPIGGKLGAGKYTINWHALSTDGHKTQGTYTVTVKP